MQSGWRVQRSCLGWTALEGSGAVKCRFGRATNKGSGAADVLKPHGWQTIKGVLPCVDSICHRSAALALSGSPAKPVRCSVDWGAGMRLACDARDGKLQLRVRGQGCDLGRCRAQRCSFLSLLEAWVDSIRDEVRGT